MRKTLISCGLILLAISMTDCQRVEGDLPTAPVEPESIATIKCNGSKDSCTVIYNSSVRIEWSAENVTACTITGTLWGGLTGSQYTDKLKENRDYELKCTGTKGATVTSIVKVIVEPPFVPGGPGEPTIEFTDVPERGSYFWLKGTVSHVYPDDHKVSCWIYATHAWWPKPHYGRQQLTSINSNGTWSCDITTGEHDPDASEVRAYLVTNAYNPPDEPPLPRVNGNDVLAVVSQRR